MTERVLVEIDAHVASVTLNRAAKKNAVDMAMFEAIIDAGERLRATPGVRAVVLRGAGGCFCAGIDVTVFAGGGLGAVSDKLDQPRGESPANFFQSAAYIWRELPVPVIAVLDGVAFGAGLQIALGADIRYAAPEVKMSVMEVKWGIVPDMAITMTARRLIAADKLHELTLTGRVFDGAEAEQLGLVTALHDDPLSAAKELAAEVAGRSPDAVRAIKQLFAGAWQDDVSAALRHEAALQKSVIGGPNQLEAVLANMEKRTPHFSDPEL